MKINIKSTVLKNILNSVYKIAYSTDTRNNIFIVEAKNKELILISDNKTLAIQKTTKELEILKEGKFVINAIIMNELCQKFDGIITIELENEKIVHFNCKKSKNRINVMDPLMFRKPTFEITGTEINLSINVFNKIIKQVSFAVQGKDGRNTFKGINLRTINKKLIASATDGSRIARIIILDETNEKIDVLIPVMFITEISRLCNPKTNQKIIFSNENVLVNIDEKTKILTKTINEIFPNTEVQLSQKTATEIFCEKKELIDAIERINVINEKDEIRSVVFKIKNQTFFLTSTNDNEVGYSEEEIKLKNFIGKDQTTILQVKFVINSLKSFDKKEVIIKFSENNGPVLFKMKDDESVISLILPFWNY